MTTFLRAKLQDGSEIVSEFEKVKGVGSKYAAQIFSGAKPFNKWTVTRTPHPQSGEMIASRSRELIRPTAIVSLAVVAPKAGMETSHNYDPQNFEVVNKQVVGSRGSFTVPAENTPEGLTPGTVYLRHRDRSNFRDYIIVRAAEGHQSEVRYYLDGRGEPAPVGGETEDSFRPDDL